jgi:hypothetical protein
MNKRVTLYRKGLRFLQVGLAVIFPFRLGKDPIVAEKAQFGKPTLSDLTLLVTVIYVFPILGHFGGRAAAFFRFQAGSDLYFSFLLT